MKKKTTKARKTPKVRKRVSKDVPAKGRLRDFADELWAKAIYVDWNKKCAICGSTEINAHHMVPRGTEATRYDLQNGICLCVHHHLWNNDLSPHMNGAGFLCWLLDHHKSKAYWYIENRRPKFLGKKNAAYYIATIRRLKQYLEPEDFLDTVGPEFAAWLEETKEDPES
jgi:hypothetical protein